MRPVAPGEQFSPEPGLKCKVCPGKMRGAGSALLAMTTAKHTATTSTRDVMFALVRASSFLRLGQEHARTAG